MDLTPQVVSDMQNKEFDLHSCAIDSSKDVVDSNKQEFNMQLDSINAELAKFDSIEDSITTSIKSNTRVAIIPPSKAHLSEARDHQNTNRC